MTFSTGRSPINERLRADDAAAVSDHGVTARLVASYATARGDLFVALENGCEGVAQVDDCGATYVGPDRRQVNQSCVSRQPRVRPGATASVLLQDRSGTARRGALDHGRHRRTGGGNVPRLGRAGRPGPGLRAGYSPSSSGEVRATGQACTSGRPRGATVDRVPGAHVSACRSSSGSSVQPLSRPRLERGRFKRPRLLHAAARASRMGSHPSRAISPVHGEKRDASSSRLRIGPPSVQLSIAPLDNGVVLLAPAPAFF